MLASGASAPGPRPSRVQEALRHSHSTTTRARGLNTEVDPLETEPTVSSLLVDKIDSVEKNLNARLDKQDKELDLIKTQTQKTNGRVTVLEKARERTAGAVGAFRWMPPALMALLTAGTTILIMALSGGIK